MADTSRRLAAEGLVLGTAGNVSQRAGDRVAITPTGAVLGELDAGRRGGGGPGRPPGRRPAGAHLRAGPAPRRDARPRLRRGGAHPRAHVHRRGLRAGRAALRALRDAGAGRPRARGALRHLRHPRAGGDRGVHAAGADRGADGQPRRGDGGRDRRGGGGAVAAAGVGGHRLPQRGRGGTPARAGRGPARRGDRGGAGAQLRLDPGGRGRGGARHEGDRHGRARGRRAGPSRGGDPRGPGRSAAGGDPDHGGRLGRRHGADAGQAGRGGHQRRRHRHRRLRRRAGAAARGRRRGPRAAGAPHRRADLGHRAAHPPQRRAARAARDRRQRHLRPRRRALGRDRRGHPPAPGRARVHGRRGRRPDPLLRPRARRGHLRRHPGARASRRPRSWTGSHPPSSTWTTCCPTTSRCWRCRAPTTSRPAPGRCWSGASAAWPPPRARTGPWWSPPRAPSGCPRSRSRWWTPRAVATRSAPASCAGARWTARCATRPCWAARRPGRVAEGLGSDHGDFDLESLDAFVASSRHPG